MNSNFFSSTESCEETSKEKKIPKRIKSLFTSYSRENAYKFAKILGQLQCYSKEEREHAETKLLKLYHIQDVACSEHERIFIRPKLIDLLERLTFEYLNILRYDVNAIEKYSGFICTEKESVFNGSIFKWSNCKISDTTLMYVEAALKRNYEYFHVSPDDGFPKESDSYQHDFFINFMMNPIALMSTIVLIDVDAKVDTISKKLVKELQKTGQSVDGVHIFNGKDIRKKMYTESSLFYQKNIMLIF